MKKIVFALACIVLTTTAFSQVKVRPGIKLGLNNSNINGMDGASSKTGFYAGAFVNVDISSFYELQLETMYSNQGATVRVSELYVYDSGDPFFNNNDNTTDINLQYLSIGIANKFFIVKDLGLHFIVGPSIDILVDDDNFTNFTPIDLAFFGGIGYEFPFGLSIEARYKQGIIDLDDGFTTFGSNSSGYDKNYLNSVIQVGAAYKFNF